MPDRPSGPPDRSPGQPFISILQGEDRTDRQKNRLEVQGLLCPGKACFLKGSIGARGVSNRNEYDQGSGGASEEGPSSLAEGKMPAASTLTAACPCPGSVLEAGGGQIERRTHSRACGPEHTHGPYKDTPRDTGIGCKGRAALSAKGSEIASRGGSKQARP